MSSTVAPKKRHITIDGYPWTIDGVTCQCGAGCRIDIGDREVHDGPHTFWHRADDGYLERPHRHDPETGRRIPGPFPRFVAGPEKP